jgi:hypothetical protein
MGEPARLDDLAQLKQRHYFVDAWQGGPHKFLYFGSVEKSPVLKDFGHGTSKLPLEILKCVSGIHLTCIEGGPAVSAYQAGVRPDRFSKAVGKRVSRIRREEVDSIIAFCTVEQSDSCGAGSRCLSYSTLPDEEKDALLKKLGRFGVWLVCAWFPGHGAANRNGPVLAEHCWLSNVD